MKQIILSFIIAVTVFGCASSSKKYDKGDYDSAMEISAKKLKKIQVNLKRLTSLTMLTVWLMLKIKLKLIG